ncbi:MAG: T9SS type A sorting domain-containing protein [Flavobacteriales bacterium]|nr:T9SS type A sorting domain-containing protein [Flavobacteriales bacterium]
MTNGQFLTLSVALVATSMHAQTTFAPVGAKWTYKQGSWAGPDTNLMVLEATTDTLIQGRTFTKLQVNEGWFGCHEFVQFFSESNDSLFYFEPDSEQVHLLFRWNALIGESWSTPVEQSGYLDTLDWTVTDTSHTIIDGLWLRTLEVNAESRQWTLFSYGGVYTERLGSYGAPFTWILGFCDGETFLGLRCYEDPEINWQSPQVTQCELGLGVDERDGVRMEIMPTLVLRGEPVQITGAVGSVDVFDATGRLVRTLTTSGRLTFAFDRSGAYVLRLTSDRGERAVQRVMVR